MNEFKSLLNKNNLTNTPFFYEKNNGYPDIPIFRYPRTVFRQLVTRTVFVY